MTPGSSTGWQTMLCDLAIILFMITAAAVSEADAAGQGDQPAAVPLLGEPVAVWRAGGAGLSLGDWLGREGVDARLQLTIVAGADQAQAALDLAATAGRPARLVIEPGITGAPYAALAYDRQQAVVARPLRENAAIPGNQEDLR